MSLLKVDPPITIDVKDLVSINPEKRNKFEEEITKIWNDGYDFVMKIQNIDTIIVEFAGKDGDEYYLPEYKRVNLPKRGGCSP